MSRRDDINKLYQPSKTLEKVCYALFTADIAISLIAACVGGSVISYLTVALVIIAFLYMAISIIDDGIILTGGGAVIDGLDERIAAAVGVKCRRADDIINCVVKGAAIALDGIDTVTDVTHIFHKKAYIRD